MSRKKPIKITIDEIDNPEAIFESEVVKSGNGAVIRSYLRYLGREVIVIVKKQKDPRQKPYSKKEQDALDKNWKEQEGDGYFKAIKKKKKKKTKKN